MRSANTAEYRELLKKAERQGWAVQSTRKSHIKLIGPTGQLVFASGTPSDWRSFLNFRAHLKREGLGI
jgi:hypothetical protein